VTGEGWTSARIQNYVSSPITAPPCGNNRRGVRAVEKKMNGGGEETVKSGVAGEAEAHDKPSERVLERTTKVSAPGRRNFR